MIERGQEHDNIPLIASKNPLALEVVCLHNVISTMSNQSVSCS